MMMDVSRTVCSLDVEKFRTITKSELICSLCLCEHVTNVVLVTPCCFARYHVCCMMNQVVSVPKKFHKCNVCQIEIKKVVLYVLLSKDNLTSVYPCEVDVPTGGTSFDNNRQYLKKLQ